MLVLSRKLHEKLVFPAIHATVQVVSVKGGIVRLGIEAPRDVTVLRSELQDESAKGPAAPEAAAASRLPTEIAHSLRNHLNAASVGLALLRRQRELGLEDGSATTLECLDREVEAMRRQVEDATCPTARRPRVLLVEDDSNERELLAGLLRLHGLEVSTAGDGLDALEHLRQRRPDVVLLDMGLPRCDGASTVREIRREPEWAGLKVLAVTGRSPDEFEAVGGPAADVNGWLRKPVNPEALLRVLQRQLAEVA